MEQEPRICPLCGSPVRLFFINFSEKLLMCEDPNCDFPFGYEELQIVTDESELRENFDTASSISLGPYNGMSAASSVISTAAWSDIERLNRIYDSEDCTADSRMSFTSDAVKKQRERRKAQEEIQKNLDNIEKLNTELNILKHVDKDSIEKDDWLQNLLTLQGVSGRKLLKDDEIKKLKMKEPDFGMGELKININTVPNDIGLINIEIINEDNELQSKNVCGDNRENKIQIQLDDMNVDENGDNDNQKDNQHDNKVNLGNNQQVITLNESINKDSDIQGTEENEHHINNNINSDEIPSNDTLPELNLNFNEINNFVTDSDINCDNNLVDVKTIVINNNNFTLIELKGAIQDINSQTEIENVKDIQIDSTNTTVDTSITANEENQLNEENINKNMSKQKEIEYMQNHDTTINNNMTGPNEDNTILTNSNINSTSDDNLNDRNYDNNYLENEKIDESLELETSAINKEINILLETEKLKTNANLDIKDIIEINNKSGESEKKQNQGTMSNSEKSNLLDNSKESKGKREMPNKQGKPQKSGLMNSSKDQEETMNDSKKTDSMKNTKELEYEGKIPKKRGRPKKTDLMNSSKDQEETINNSKESDLMLSSTDQADTMNNSKKSDLMNSSKDQEETMNDSKETNLMDNTKESEYEGKIPKKRGRPKKGTRVLEQPLRRSSRISK